MNDHPLRVWRRENSVKLADLARLAKTTPSSLSRIERGIQDPSIALLMRIIQATGNSITLHHFFEEFIKNDTP